MKLLIQIILLIFCIQTYSSAGESGELPGQEVNNIEETFEETPKEQEGVDVSSVSELLDPKNTNIDLPKNRLLEIFNQYFLSELNNEINIIKECENIIDGGKCYVVEPIKSSNHFNNYYFYTNSLNQVYSIIAFNDMKQGDLNKCKDKIASWKEYFNSFDLTEKENDNSLNFILTDAPQQNTLEVFASCYTEEYRDIKSSFSIKFFKNT